MPIKKIDFKYRVIINRKGIPRINRLFDHLRDAESFERDTLFKYLGIRQFDAVVQAPTPPTTLSVDDNRSLFELLEIWWKYHGVNLADGKRRKAILELTFARIPTQPAKLLSPQQFLDLRYELMHSDNKPISAKTFNNRQTYIAAMFRTLKKLKVIDYDCPINDVDMIKIQERQLTFLNKAQIVRLFDLLKSCRNKQVWWIAQICIRTGARWGEAECLKRKQLHNNRVTFEITKSKKVRTVPLDPLFFADLIDFARLKNPEEQVFKVGYKAFERVLARSDMDLPKGQLTHILRHTFASHFIMNGGNILTLKEILGHSDIKQTMRYAHLCPSHLADAVRFNPLFF